MIRRATFILALCASALAILPWAWAPLAARRRLESGQERVVAALARYVAARRDEWAFAASDNVLRSSFLQFAWNQDLASVQSHMATLVGQFDALRALALYDRNGRLLAATDDGLAEAVLPPGLLAASERQTFGISRSAKDGDRLLSVTGPLRNPFGFRIGFVRAFFSLEPLVAEVALAEGQVLVLRTGSGSVRLPAGRGEEPSADRWALRVEGEIPGTDMAWTLLQSRRPVLPWSFWLAEASMLAALAVLAIVGHLRHRKAEEARRLREAAETVLRGSQETLRRVEEAKVSVEEFRAKVPETVVVRPQDRTVREGGNPFLLVGP